MIVSESGSAFFYKGEHGRINMVTEPKVYTFDCAVRSAAWNKLKPTECAVGTFDSQIYIINTETHKFEHVLECKGGKVLTLAFHPYFDYILASGTADFIVRVWDVKNNGHKVLKFH